MNIEKNARNAAIAFQNGNHRELRPILIETFKEVKYNPDIILKIENFSLVAKTFYLMLEQKIADDIEVQQQISAIGYYIISKAITIASNKLELIKDRLLIMYIGQESLMYTINDTIEKPDDKYFSPIIPSYRNSMFSEAKDALLLMNFADLSYSPVLNSQIELLSNWYQEYKQKIEQNEIKGISDIKQAVVSGNANHNKFFNYLHDRIIVNKDFDF
jgi:hypothetical protein